MQQAADQIADRSRLGSVSATIHPYPRLPIGKECRRLAALAALPIPCLLAFIRWLPS
jgi:hypothetical protein